MLPLYPSCVGTQEHLCGPCEHTVLDKVDLPLPFAAGLLGFRWSLVTQHVTLDFPFISSISISMMIRNFIINETRNPPEFVICFDITPMWKPNIRMRDLYFQ